MCGPSHRKPHDAHPHAGGGPRIVPVIFWATSSQFRRHLLAVMRGEVRTRLKGRVLEPEWVKQISKMTFLEGESFALPGDVVEDVRRKFGTKRGQHRRS
jgi:hypothetical protein